MHKIKYVNIERIQGTDGVRGKSAFSWQAGIMGLSPIEVFLEKGIITEEFVELYAFCWARLAGAEIRGGPAREFIVGRDPRDKGGLFLKAACDGIRKAGFKAVDIGILPTPAVAVYISKRGSIGGFSITASHNPGDENGVKIFAGSPAIKLLPKEEMDLTKELLAANRKGVKKALILGDYEDANEDARKTFIDFHLDHLNLRAQEGAPPLRGGVFVLDGANGSLSGCLREVFGALGAEYVHLVNCDLGGEVNRGGAAADAFAGVSSIGPEDVFSKGARFGDCAMARLLFQEGRKLKEKLLGDRLTLSGAGFDADGDRCIRVDYDPLSDRLRVLSGDEMASQVALLACERSGGKMGRAPMIASIESDMGATEAAHEMGLRTIFTPVGDKWLLMEGWVSFLKRVLELCSKSGDDKWRYAAHELADQIEWLRSQWPASAFSLSDIYKKVVELVGGAEGIDRIACRALCEGSQPFVAASEPSGHIILFSTVKTAGGLKAPVIVGSGLGAALASFVSTKHLKIAADPSLYYRNLTSPFVKGVKISYYIHYVEKRALMRDAAQWTGLKKAIHSAWDDLFAGSAAPREIIWPQEKDMLYLELGRAQRGPKAVIFARRSGTEDVARLTLKGPRGLEKELVALGLLTYKYMALNMKRLKSSGARAQLELIRMAEGPIEKPAEASAHEMQAAVKACLKEGLIEKKGDELSPTELGRWFLRSVR